MKACVAQYIQTIDDMHQTLETANLTDSEFTAVNEELIDQAGLKTTDTDDLMDELWKLTGAKVEIVIDDGLYAQYLADKEADNA